MSGPVPSVLAPLTVPASWVYAAAIRRRNARYDRGVGVRRVDRTVISIGNITTGGTGKTPMVAWIAARLRAAGHHPVIAMRGYGGRPGEPSDEQQEYADRLPEVAVVAAPDRHTALAAHLAAHRAVDVVLLDDGFQHRRLARDLDLVLVDATRPALDDRLLPAGHLRETPASLARADGVIVTRAAEVDATLARRIARHHGAPPLAWCRHAWTRLRRPATDDCVEPAWLDGRRVMTVLGVGNAASVRADIEAAGAVIVDDVPARDHQRYDRRQVAAIGARARGTDAVVTTAKDWAKIRHLIDWSGWTVPIAVPDVAIEFLAGEDALVARVLAVMPAPVHRSPPS